MEEKKRKRIGILLFVAAFLVLAFFVFGRIHKSQENPSTVSDLEGIQSESGEKSEGIEGYRARLQKDYDYENMENLWFLGSVTQKDFRDSLEQWLEETDIECSKIRVLREIEEIKKDQEYAFYLQMDESPELVKGIYEIPDKQFTYQIDGKHSELAKIGGVDAELNQSVEEAPADGYYPENAADDVGDVELWQTDSLPEEIKQEELKIQILAFLNQQQELRRQLTVAEVISKDHTIELRLEFVTQRLDRKHLQVVYDKESQQYQISLVQ